MKHIVLVVCSMIILLPTGKAQCNINAQDILGQYCTGSYLMHYEMNNRDVQEVSLVLQEGRNFSIYLVNPSHPFSAYRTFFGNTEITDRFELVKKDKAIVYNLNVSKTGEYKFKLQTTTAEKACVLLAVYLPEKSKTGLKEGMYRSLDEIKSNRPGEPLKYELKRVRLSRREGDFFYRIKIGKTDRQRVNEIVGFSDGKDFYINNAADKWKFSSAAQFVKVEKLGNYFYFEAFQEMYIPTSTYGGMLMYDKSKKLMDLESGKIIGLTKNSLREIIKDDPELVREFDNESRKSTKLKEYLQRYLEQKGEKK